MNKKQKKGVKIVAVTILFLAIAAIVYANLNSKPNLEENEDQKTPEPIAVEALLVTQEKDLDLYIETVASIQPETKVDVVALGNGTIKSLPFDLGDSVKNSQVLAYLNSNITQTSFLNAQTNYYNMLNNLEAVKRSTEESINQAEIGVQQADEALSNAKNSLKTAEKNYEASLSLQVKSLENTQDNAISSISSYTLTVKDALEDVNYIINAETGEQLPGISQTLSAQNLTALTIAKNDYLNTKREYNNLKDLEVNKNNLETSLEQMINLLNLIKKTVNDTIIVLDNTVSSSNLSQQTLDAQRQAFSALYSQAINVSQSAENTLNSLRTLKISQEKEVINLKNSVESAKNQVALAKLAYNNALTSLQSAKQGKQQQILAAQAQVDNALGQLNLNQQQLSDLVIKAPIAGQITAKTVEIGTELSPGQKIAEIAKLDKLKIEANISPEDAISLRIGQKVIINEETEAEISAISPNADPITKKIKVEALIDNQERKLTPGTFVNIKIKKDDSSVIENGKVKIPLEAVSITQTENYVFLAIENQNNELIAKKTEVDLGETEKNLIEVAKGIKANDKVIISGSKLLQDGDLIMIK
ncbi:MAG: efflux RND transporter periplasmic adaptor subunit [Candidatus Pacebacteria bacterium]|nr:efflux RND transporter periplasmic adaptor subunit [Candidatus Paceibacterota bacterium]